MNLFGWMSYDQATTGNESICDTALLAEGENVLSEVIANLAGDPQHSVKQADQ